LTAVKAAPPLLRMESPVDPLRGLDLHELHGCRDAVRLPDAVPGRAAHGRYLVVVDEAVSGRHGRNAVPESGVGEGAGLAGVPVAPPEIRALPGPSDEEEKAVRLGDPRHGHAAHVAHEQRGAGAIALPDLLAGSLWVLERKYQGRAVGSYFIGGARMARQAEHILREAGPCLRSVADPGRSATLEEEAAEDIPPPN